MTEFHRSFAEINLSAIDHNLNEIKKLLSENVKTLAVVKEIGRAHV